MLRARRYFIGQTLQQDAVPLPSKDEILAFIGEAAGQGRRARDRARLRSQERPPRAAQAGAARASGDGRVESRRKKLHHRRRPALGHACRHHRARQRRRTDRHADRMGRGRTAPPPKIRILAPPAQSPARPPASATARCCASRRSTTRTSRYSGRVIKVIDRAKQRVLGIFRALPGGGGRLVPVDKKQLGRELAIAPRRTAGTRRTATWSRSSVSAQGRFGLPSARVEERLGSLKSERAVSLIAIHAHGIPHVFPQAASPRRRRQSPHARRRPRGLAQAAARHHRPGRRQGPRRRGPRRARSGPEQSGRPHRHRRDRRRRALRDARAPRSTAKRSSAAIRSISRTASCRCCRSASPTICARCARARIAPRSRCA